MLSVKGSVSVERVLGLAALFFPVALVMVLVAFPVQDFDTFWHLANGRAMVEGGGIVSEEIFSYTMTGAPFYNHEWLSQIVLYLIYAAWGGAGLVGFKAVLSACVFMFEYRTLRGFGAGGVSASLLSVAGIFAGLDRYRERPEIFSLVFLALLIWLMHSVREGRLKSRALLAIPFVMVLWECLHGGVYGLVFLGAFAGAETVERWWRGRSGGAPERSSHLPLGMLWGVVGVTVVVLLISPYGLRQYGTFFSFARKGLMVGMVEEFQRTPFGEYRFYWVMLAVAWALVILFFRRLDLVHIATLFVFSLLSVRYLRATAPFALVAVPVIGRYAIPAMEKGSLRRIWAGAKYVFWGLAIAGAVHLKFLTPGSPFEFGWGVDERRLPLGEARFIRDTGLGGNMYNPGNFGGTLAYELFPERGIFLYNHHVVFEQLLRETFDRRFIDKYNINYAVLRHGDWGEDRLFPDGPWVTVYWDSAGRVVVRNSPENSDYLARYGLTYYLPGASSDALDLVLRYEPSRMSLIREVARVARYASNPSASRLQGLAIEKYREDLPADETRQMLRGTLVRNPQSAELRAALRELGG
jgi:hypothetical protein